MAEKEQTTQTAAAPQPEAPRAEPTKTADTNVAAGTKDKAGEGKGTSKGISQSKASRLLEINEQLNKGVLTIDERAKLEDEKKALEGEADADGETKELKDDDAKKDDENDNKFAEQDIIKYMYNEWLIKLGCWCGDKIEKAGGNAYHKLKRRTLAGIAEGKAQADAIKNSDTYKAYKKVKNLKEGTSEEIKKRDKDRLKTVQDLAVAIGDGKMAADSANDLLALAKYMNVKPEDVKDNQDIQNIVQASLKHKQNQENLYQTLGISVEDVTKNPKLISERMKELKKDKENPDLYKEALEKQKEVKDSQKELCNLGARFAQKEARKISFDSMVDQAALAMAEAKMLDEIAKNGKAYEGKDLGEVFKGQTEQYRNDFNEITNDERQRYVDGKNTKTVYTASGAAPAEVNVMGSIEKYNSMAHEASNESIGNIANLRFKEMEQINGRKVQPRENKNLKNLEGFIKESKKTHTPPSDERLEQAEQEAEQAPRSTNDDNTDKREDTPQNLGEDAALNKEKDAKLHAQENDNRQRADSLSAREFAHNERGNSILLRINQIKNQKTQQLIAEGKKNNFQGWKYVSKGQEM